MLRQITAFSNTTSPHTLFGLPRVAPMDPSGLNWCVHSVRQGRGKKRVKAKEVKKKKGKRKEPDADCRYHSISHWVACGLTDKGLGYQPGGRRLQKMFSLWCRKPRRGWRWKVGDSRRVLSGSIRVYPGSHNGAVQRHSGTATLRLECDFRLVLQSVSKRIPSLQHSLSREQHRQHWRQPGQPGPCVCLAFPLRQPKIPGIAGSDAKESVYVFRTLGGPLNEGFIHSMHW